MSRRLLPLLFVLVFLFPEAVFPGGVPRDPRKVRRGTELTVTRTVTDLDGDGRREGVMLVEVLTGEKDPARATEVILGTWDAGAGEKGELLWSRCVTADTGQPAHDGEMEILDLDGDGQQEIVLSWDRGLRPGLVDRWAEIWTVPDPRRPVRVWEGPWGRDTRLDEQTPPAKRSSFEREIDYGATRAAKGRGIVFRDTWRMIEGQALDPPRVTRERVDVLLRR